MHIHILGICGTFMGSLAQIAKAAGHRVTGSDANVYPPMSTQLEQAGIELTEGFDPAQLDPAPDLVVVGNAMSRGNPCIESLLNKGLPYTSGPQWLGEHVLREKWVLAVAGTHGKTTTATMLAWILDYAGMSPGFLIGGVPGNFGVSARLGRTPFFVVEADEYDTAFFDKRSKFVHYQPRTLILNNLEFDHADIFSDLAAIQTQFHHLVRIVPEQGLIIYPEAEGNLQHVIDQGCWTPTETIGTSSGWQAEIEVASGELFNVFFQQDYQGQVKWSQTGNHNVSNGLAAISAARHVGVQPAVACEALSHFSGVKRRMEAIGQYHGVKVYDDFAHHPTAIETTLDGLRKQVGRERIVAVIEPRSNTMKLGVHSERLAESASVADEVLWFEPENLGWSLQSVVESSTNQAQVVNTIDKLVTKTLKAAGKKAHVVIMSNGGFAGFHQRFLDALKGAAHD